MAAIPALYWATQNHDSPNIEGIGDMFVAAREAMKAIGLTNVKINQDDVSGFSADAISAITCLRCGKVYTLVVMVAGSNNADAQAILGKLLKEIPHHIPNL